MKILDSFVKLLTAIIELPFAVAIFVIVATGLLITLPFYLIWLLVLWIMGKEKKEGIKWID